MERQIRKPPQRLWPLFLKWFWVLCQLSCPSKQKTNTHTMVEWCMTTMVLSICNEAPPTLNKGKGNTSPWTTRRKRQWSKEWLFFLPKTPLFTLQTLSWQSLHSLTTTISLLSVVIPWMEKPTQVWWVVLFLGSTWWWVFGWCWWTTMSHITTTTPTMCAFTLFTTCAFHSHPLPQMVFMWWSL